MAETTNPSWRPGAEAGFVIQIAEQSGLGYKYAFKFLEYRK
jgi:hypothetical protein